MKKFLIINILLVILLNSFYVCFANESKLELIKYEKDCETYLKYQGNFKTAHYAFYESNGKEMPVYCVNPEYSGVNRDLPEYSVKVNGKITNEKIWKAIVNGYPYKSLEELGVNCKEEAYTATQFAIYTVLHNRNVADYESNGTDGGKRTLNAYQKIMKNVQEMNGNMKIETEIIPDTTIWELNDNETEYLSKSYKLKSNFSNGSFLVNLNGENIDGIKLIDENGKEKNNFKINEKFKILVPINILTEDIKFEIEAKGKLDSKPILFGETMIPETQNYALTGNTMEDFNYKYEEEIPENITKIKIIKQEVGTEKRIEGVKFNLLNSNKDSVMQNLTTDKNGEIVLENLIPGVYYLQEIEAPELYNINLDAIEINLKLNQEVEVVVENSLKEIPKVIVENPITVPEKTLPVTGY